MRLTVMFEEILRVVDVVLELLPLHLLDRAVVVIVRHEVA
jgi:hypothetical protein